MTNVIDSLPMRMRPLFVEVLNSRSPVLLATLQDHEEPTREEREFVEDILAKEFSRCLQGDGEPTARGVEVDALLGAFLRRWPL